VIKVTFNYYYLTAITKYNILNNKKIQYKNKKCIKNNKAAKILMRRDLNVRR